MVKQQAGQPRTEGPVCQAPDSDVLHAHGPAQSPVMQQPGRAAYALKLTKLAADPVVIFTKEGGLVHNACASISCDVGVGHHPKGACVTAWLSFQALKKGEHGLVGLAYQF